ncbi:MAG: hypothetical protein WCC79_03740, partial [Nitrososphaeraceae archaeon]
WGIDTTQHQSNLKVLTDMKIALKLPNQPIFKKLNNDQSRARIGTFLLPSVEVKIISTRFD